MCVALFAVAFGTNVPPLLLVYELRLHLSAAALTAMFGAYAVGLVPALLASGPVPGVVAGDLVPGLPTWCESPCGVRGGF